jgi:hypothetical protein
MEFSQPIKNKIREISQLNYWDGKQKQNEFYSEHAFTKCLEKTIEKINHDKDISNAGTVKLIGYYPISTSGLCINLNYFNPEMNIFYKDVFTSNIAQLANNYYTTNSKTIITQPKMDGIRWYFPIKGNFNN